MRGRCNEESGEIGRKLLSPQMQGKSPRCKVRTEDLAGMHSSALVGMNGFLKSHSIYGEKIDTLGEVMNPLKK